MENNVLLRVFRRVDSVFHRLALVPCSAYALLYLAMVPLFGTIYYLMPGEFYHSSVRFEQALDKDAAEILTGIEKEIRNNHTRDSGVLARDWFLDADRPKWSPVHTYYR